jgi:hypothetical protein
VSSAQNCGSDCMFNNARFVVDGIVKRETIRVGARHGSTCCLSDRDAAGFGF